MPSIYNAALEGVAKELKMRGVKFVPEKISEKITLEEMRAKFSGELEKAKNLAKPLENFNRDALAFSAADALLKAVGDSHTYFLYPENWQEHQKMFGNESLYSGIGAAVGHLEKDYIYLAKVFPDSPAAKAGLRRFDRIMEVDGKVPRDTLEAMRSLRGGKGTVAEMTVKRKDKRLKVKIVRNDIHPPHFSAEPIYLKNRRVDYLEVDDFMSAALIGKMKNYLVKNSGKPDGVILDLRGNPGGDVQVVMDFSDFFFKEATPIFISAREGEQPFIWFSATKSGSLTIKCPIVVLIDGLSGSGAEILAAAMQENKRAAIVGKKSAGAVSVGTDFNFYRGAAMNLAIEAVFTPKGKRLEKAGVRPDVPLDMNKNDIRNGIDTQLQEALRILNKKSPT